MLGTLNAEQMEQLLHAEFVGRLGCHADGRTYVVPVTYCYAEGFIWGHTGEGLKVRMLRQNPQVCFEVDHLDDMANWRSVIVQGRFEELTGDQANHAMHLLMQRLMPLVTSESAAPSHGVASMRPDTPDTHRADTAHRRPVVYRLAVESKSGRFERR